MNEGILFFVYTDEIKTFGHYVKKDYVTVVLLLKLYKMNYNFINAKASVELRNIQQEFYKTEFHRP